MQLYNRKNKKEQLEEVKRSALSRRTVSFYRYHRLPNAALFREFARRRDDQRRRAAALVVMEVGRQRKADRNCLARARLAVSEDNHVVAVDCALDQPFAVLEDVQLS